MENRVRVRGNLVCALALLLVALMCAAGLSLTAQAAETRASGTCGGGLTWTLDADGVLTIDGTGDMDSFISGKAPWYSERSGIFQVRIGSGVSFLRDRAFCDCTSLSSVTFAEGSQLSSVYYSSGCSPFYRVPNYCVFYVSDYAARWAVQACGIDDDRIVTMQNGKKPVDALTIEVSNDQRLVYDGSAKAPAITVKEGMRALTADVDYTASYSDNVDAGEATVTITGTGDYCSTKTASFEIQPAELLAPAAVTGLVYNGSEQTGVEASEYFTVENGSATNAGDYKAVLIADGSHCWPNGSRTTTLPWSIARKAVEVPVAATGLVYDGTEQTGVASGEGYSVESGSATSMGDHTATLELDANHVWADGSTDAKEITWCIHGKAVAVPKAVEGLVYNGEVQTGVPDGEGYTVSYASGKETDAGTYTAKLVLKSGYEWEDGTTGAKEVKWSIARITVDESALQRSFTFNGKDQHPDFDAAGLYDEDYDEDEDATIDAGTYTATVSPDWNYQWSDGSRDARQISWTIAKKVVAIPTAKPRLKYNGILQRGVSETSGCTVEGGSAKKGGRYTAIASLGENYDEEDWDDDEYSEYEALNKAKNYVWADSTSKDKKIPWTLTQIVFGDDGDLVYGGKVKVTVLGACKGDRLKVKIGKKGYAKKIKKNANSKKFTFKAKTKAGTKVKATVLDSKKKKVISSSSKVSQNRASVSVSNVYQVSGKVKVTVLPVLAGDKVKVKVSGKTYTKKVKKTASKKKLSFNVGSPTAGKKVKVTVYNKYGQKRGSASAKVYYAANLKKGMTKWQVRHIPDCGSPDSTNNGTVGWYSYENDDGTLWLTVYFTYGRVSSWIYW